MRSGKGFIAALDQSGGSTPKALKLYGHKDGDWADDAGMYGLIHAMRARIATSPAFDGKRVVGAILFEKTMIDIFSFKCCHIKIFTNTV